MSSSSSTVVRLSTALAGLTNVTVLMDLEAVDPHFELAGLQVLNGNAFAIEDHDIEIQQIGRTG